MRLGALCGTGLKVGILCFGIALWQAGSLGWAQEGHPESQKESQRESQRESHKEGYKEKLKLVQAYELALRQRLSQQPDPFAGQGSFDRNQVIWEHLIRGFPLLVEIRAATHRALQTDTPLDADLERRVVEEIYRIVSNPNATYDQMAGALLAAQRLRDFYKLSDPQADKKKSEDGEDPSKGSKEKKQKEKKKRKPADPSWESLPEEYEVRNKDTESGEGEDQEKVTIAWVDQPNIAYFRGMIYQQVRADTGRLGTLSVVSSEPNLSGQPSALLTLNTSKVKEQVTRLLLPVGYFPQTGSFGNTVVWRDDSQNYFFSTTDDEVVIPLFTASLFSTPLNPSERAAYLAPTGIALSDWPLDLRQQIEGLIVARNADLQKGAGRYAGPLGEIQLAKDLGSFIARYYKYKVDADASYGVLEAVQGGAFQCDVAAALLTSILRESFGIPSRVAVGYRGMRHQAMPGSSHVAMPATGHAWTEVADPSGNWWVVDATPRKKDRKSEQKGKEKDEYKNITPPDADKDEDSDDDQEGSPDGESGDQELTQKSVQELRQIWKKLQEEKREAREKAQRAQGKGQGKEGENGKGGSGKEEGAESEIEGDAPNHHLDDLLEKNHPALAHLLKRYLLWVLDPKLGSDLKLERLSQAKASLSLLGRVQKELAPALTEATGVFSHKNPPWIDWLREIQNNLRLRPVATSADELAHLQRQIQFVLKLMDPVEARPYEELLRTLLGIRRELNQIKSPNSEAIRIVEDFMAGLPGNISKRAIREQYGLGDRPTDDLGTFKLAEALGKGKLNEFRLESLLGPHTDFVVDPIQKASWHYMKTWHRALRKQKGRPDLLITRDPRDRRKSIKLNKVRTDEEALKLGEMFYLGQRRKDPLPQGQQDVEPEKATVLLYDTSGSMAGDAAYFQSMYIAALVDRALSDTGAGGRQRHKVYLMGFGSDVQAPIEVASAKQALDLVTHAQDRTRNTGDGTDIEKALISAADLLAENAKSANARGDRALARATVVLMSDGESAVDAQKVKAAFARTEMGKRSKMDLLLAFVAINGSNPILQNLAHRTDLGAKKGMYLEWSREDIAKMLEDSKAKPVALNDFWTKLPFDELPGSVHAAFALLQRDLLNLQGVQLAGASTLEQTALEELRRKLDAWTAGGASKGQTIRSGSYVRVFSQLKMVLDWVAPSIAPEDRVHLLGNLVLHWKKFFPDDVSAYDSREVEQLKEMLEWVGLGDFKAKL